MKGSDYFQKAIKDYLDKRAAEDPQFAEKYANEKKSISGCCDYIYGEVSATQQSGFADEEIFGMAVHYYDEENIETKPNHVQRVVSNYHVDLSEEEKAEARKQAIAAYQNEVRQSMMRKPAAAAKPKEEEQPQLSLF